MTVISRGEWMYEILQKTFSPEILEITDDSARHAHHPGRGNGGHFTLTIKAQAFADKSLIQCHRLIYAALGEVVGKDIHALSIKVVK